MTDAANEHQEALAHRAVVERLWTAPVFDACRPGTDVPDSSSILIAESRCGYVPEHILDFVPDDTRVIALDPSRAMLDQARQRVDEEAQKRVFFVPQRVNSLSYADDVFRASICLNGVVTVRQVHEALSELARVTSPGGSVTLVAPLRDSFPELYDMFDEALRAHQLHDVLGRLYELRDAMVTPARLMDLAEEVGVLEPELVEIQWEVSFDSGQEVLFSPLVRETFFPHWIGIIRSSDREPILRYIADAIDTYWHGGDFTCSITAACLKGFR